MSAAHGHTAGGHEPETASIRGVIAVGAVILILVAIAMGAVAIQLSYYRSTEPDRQTMNPTELPQVPERVNAWAHPGIDLKQFKANEQELLTEYRWIDKDHGIVRIPIDRAMQLVAQESSNGSRK